MILKFQQGGAALPPLVSYQPVTLTGGGGSSAAVQTSQKTKNEDLTDAEVFKLLDKVEGLPNDMTSITEQLQNFYIDQKYGKASTSSIETKYLQILNSIKIANFNKKEYDAAYDVVSKNGGINELAITDRGQLFCTNVEGDFKLMTIQELKNSEGYSPLTNSELLYYRAQAPDMVNKNNILKIVKNGIGMEAVTKMIQTSIAGLGSTQKSEQGYVNQDSKKLIRGLEDYMKAAASAQEYNKSIDSLYKASVLTQDQTEQAKLAIDYIWNTLPENAKTLLQTKTKGGSEEEAKQLMSELIVSKTSNTHNFNISLDSVTGKSGSGSKSGSNDTTKNDPVKSFILGKGYQQPIGINVGNSYTHTVNGRYGVLIDKQGKALGANSSLEDVSSSAYAGVLDMNSATFGGIKLNTNQSRKVLLDSADIIGMDLPIDQAAKEKYGIIRPDLTMLSRLEKAEEYIRYNNITNPEEINKVFVEHNLPEKFKNENGQYNLDLLNYQRFARLSGVVEESALPEDSELDGTVQEIQDDNLRTSVEEVLKAKDKDYSMSNGVFGWGATELYRGAIYIPVREDLVAASLGSGDYYELPGSDATQVAQEFDQTQKVQGYQKPPSLGNLN